MPPIVDPNGNVLSEQNSVIVHFGILIEQVNC